MTFRSGKVKELKSSRKKFHSQFKPVLLGSLVLLLLLGSYMGSKWIGFDLDSFFNPIRNLFTSQFEQKLDELGPELEKKERHYSELTFQLQQALDSAEIQALKDVGRIELETHLTLSIQSAKSSHDEGDLDSAIRMLEVAVVRWEEALQGISLNLSHEPLAQDSNDDYPDESSKVVVDQADTLDDPITEDQQIQLGANFDTESPNPVVVEQLPDIPEMKSESQATVEVDPVQPIDSTAEKATEVVSGTSATAQLPTQKTNLEEILEADGSPELPLKAFDEQIVEAESDQLELVEQADQIEATEDPTLIESSEENILAQHQTASPVATEAPIEPKAESEQIAYVDQSSLENEITNDTTGDVQIESKATESVKSNDQLNDLFQGKLASVVQLETALAPVQEVVPGMSSSINRGLEFKDKAIDAHRKFELEPAANLISVAEEEFKNAEKLKNKFFKLNLEVAKSAYEVGQIAQAREAIALASNIHKEDKEVLQWQEKIEKYESLIQVREEVTTARTSGDLNEEMAALQNLIDLDPEDQSASIRINEIKQIQEDRLFNQAIAAGHVAIGQGDLTAANSYLASAIKIRPSDTESINLQVRVNSLARNLDIERYLKMAITETKNDNWKAALSNYKKVLKLDANHAEAGTGKEFAENLIATQDRLDDYLERPERLASSNIAKLAQSALNESKLLTAFSKRLSESSTGLETAIQEWQTPIPVRVISDGETEIGVRGVGKVGKTTERIISLRPGHYVFEGIRSGYRSILVDLVVEKNHSVVQEISVICTEKT